MYQARIICKSRLQFDDFIIKFLILLKWYGMIKQIKNIELLRGKIMMKIGIDIDGVLTDVEQWQLDYGSKYYYEKYGMRIKNYKGYEASEIFDVDKKLDDEFWNEYLESIQLM